MSYPGQSANDGDLGDTLRDQAAGAKVHGRHGYADHPAGENAEGRPDREGPELEISPQTGDRHAGEAQEKY